MDSIKHKLGDVAIDLFLTTCSGVFGDLEVLFNHIKEFKILQENTNHFSSWQLYNIRSRSVDHTRSAECADL